MTPLTIYAPGISRPYPEGAVSQIGIVPGQGREDFFFPGIDDLPGADHRTLYISLFGFPPDFVLSDHPANNGYPPMQRFRAMFGKAIREHLWQESDRLGAAVRVFLDDAFCPVAAMVGDDMLPEAEGMALGVRVMRRVRYRRGMDPKAAPPVPSRTLTLYAGLYEGQHPYEVECSVMLSLWHNVGLMFFPWLQDKAPMHSGHKGGWTFMANQPEGPNLRANWCPTGPWFRHHENAFAAMQDFNRMAAAGDFIFRVDPTA